MFSSSFSRTGLQTVLTGVLCLLLAGTPMARKIWSALSPEVHDGKVTLLVNSKERTYWRGKKDVEQVLRVTGPSTLRIISRVPWSSRYKKKDYLLDWSIEKGESGSFTHEIRNSSGAKRKADKKRISRGRSNEIEVPAGQHIVRIKLAKSPGSVCYMRYHVRFMEPMTKTRNVDLVPLYDKPGRMIQVGDSIVEYYAVAAGEEVSVEVKGPTFLKVISRLDWNQTMTGTQKYTLRVYEDGLAKQNYVLKGRPSSMAVYIDKQDTLPTRGEVIYIEVPKGDHRYTFGFQEAGRELNLRFLVPTTNRQTEHGMRN